MKKVYKVVEPSYYVSMVDDCLSGWGKSEGKHNILVFECYTEREAYIVQANAENRGDMSDIEVHNEKPYFDETKCFVQFKNDEVYPTWYKQGGF